MQKRKRKWLAWMLIMLLTVDGLSIPDVQAMQPVTITFNGEEQKDYTTINIGDILEVEAFTTDEMLEEV